MAEKEPSEDLPSVSVPLPDHLNRSELFRMANLAKEAKSFPASLKLMKELVVKMDPLEELTVEERDLLAVAYKSEFFTLQTAWFKISKLDDFTSSGSETEGEEITKIDLSPERRKEIVEEYKSVIESEIIDLYSEIHCILGELEPRATRSDSKVFYLLLQADFQKFVSRFNDGTKEKALESYIKATEIASSDLDPADPISLRLALSYSQFCKDMLNSPQQALDMAREAYNQAKIRLDDLEGEFLCQSSVIVERLREFYELCEQDMEWS